MRAFIQTKKDGKFHNDNFFKAYLEFLEMGFDTVTFSNHKEPQESSLEDVVVSNVKTVRSRLRDFGITTPEIDYPIMAIMIGIQGSGKSTFCNKCLAGFIRINLDTLHTRNKENIAINEAIAEKKSLVIDNTNTTTGERAKYILAGKEAGYRIIGFFMQSKLQDCIARNKQRDGKERIPNNAIAFTSGKMEIPSYDEGFDAMYFVSIEDGKFKIENWREE